MSKDAYSIIGFIQIGLLVISWIVLIFNKKTSLANRLLWALTTLVLPFIGPCLLVIYLLNQVTNGWKDRGL